MSWSRNKRPPTVPPKPEEAWSKAILWLSRSSLSRFDVEKRLYRIGADEETVEAVIQKLFEYGYLNDERFARGFVRYRTETTTNGSLRLMRDLSLRGIEQDEARQVVKELLPEDREVERARRIAYKKIREWTKAGKTEAMGSRLGRHLQQKGFPLDCIYRLLDELARDRSLDPPDSEN
ncbi:RecX family transcriptional regulator [Heliobacterium chlorum]|uniref:Regulatory protein RecX n=1 Tax=Heliobacterium chlorum TaxID=2698 RepID=A0ABR7T6P5_HELCL|nr:regulatory protein RecX [Heliobacterium chlorum]MBC9785767.1 RecX family transcriptional regulator [Heliobacterium chlorum]